MFAPFSQFKGSVRPWWDVEKQSSGISAVVSCLLASLAPLCLCPVASHHCTVQMGLAPPRKTGMQIQEKLCRTWRHFRVISFTGTFIYSLYVSLTNTHTHTHTASISCCATSIFAGVLEFGWINMQPSRRAYISVSSSSCLSLSFPLSLCLSHY